MATRKLIPFTFRMMNDLLDNYSTVDSKRKVGGDGWDNTMVTTASTSTIELKYFGKWYNVQVHHESSAWGTKIEIHLDGKVSYDCYFDVIDKEITEWNWSISATVLLHRIYNELKRSTNETI